MRYEGRIFRPPSEARSYILQATIGCKHNTCAFCDMYFEKDFRERQENEIIEDIQMAKASGYRPDRVFIADGDALAMDEKKLERVLDAVRETFPDCRRVGIYATASDVNEKGLEALLSLKEKGLGIIYLGLESGDDEVLKRMCKGDRSQAMISAARLVKRSGIKLSVTVISGLGGKSRWKTHAVETGKVLSQMDPDYVGLLTLVLSDETPVTQWIDNGTFTLLKPDEILRETRLMLENMAVTNCAFRSNHASNYVNLSAQLPREKDKAIAQIDHALEHAGYKPEGYRRL
ncbi:radical SAM protein [Fusibacter sp. JL216-2]|uniref:radical SAM protein n=1 Tax=Fusibacter sp. JL216-2 TaxID=3071453 RepID=UPI003D32F9FC